jgi:hypothetical protein
MYWMAMPCCFAHWVKASPRNSGPLSVRSNLRQRPFLADALDDANPSQRRDGRVDLDVDDLAVEVDREVDGAEGSATRQRIEHEIGRPDGVRMLGHV